MEEMSAPVDEGLDKKYGSGSADEDDMVAAAVAYRQLAALSTGWEIIPAREAYTDPIADEIPSTLFNNQGRVAALAHVAGVNPREMVQASEDESYLDELLEKAGVFRTSDSHSGR